MKLETARFLKDREQTLMLHYLARENIVPVKAPPWADHPFELRRNERGKRGQVGKHVYGKAATASIINVLGIRDESSCKEVREHIKHIRQSMP